MIDLINNYKYAELNLENYLPKVIENVIVAGIMRHQRKSL